MKIIPRILILAAILQLPGCNTTLPESEKKVWASSFSTDENGQLERFIPPQLWTGERWAGEKSVAYHKSEHVARPDTGNYEVHITGPHSPDKDKIKCSKQVYVRKNFNRTGHYKTQHFQINYSNRTRKGGVGRCFDWRASRGTRHMDEWSKFPIGTWKQHETDGWIEITVLGTPSNPCLSFQWRGGGIYTYCPNKGLVGIIE